LRNRAVGLVALAQLAIGAAAVFARFALVTGGPLGVSWARMSIAAIVLLVVAARRGALRAVDAASERRLVAAGVLLALHFGTWIGSLKFASVAISTLLVCTVPVWTEAYTVIRRRRVDGYAALSIAGALIGVAIVVGTPDHANTPLGIVLALAGAISFAAYLLIVRGVDARYDTLAITTRTYGYAAIALAIAMSGSGAAAALPTDARGWAGIVAMALISQLFGHTALNAAVRVLSATLVSTFTLLEPVIAGVLAAWLFGEKLGPQTALGAVVILAAIGVALRGEAREESGSEGMRSEKPAS
jgi:drug/metabolite transporter (DMT)-like permease